MKPKQILAVVTISGLIIAGLLLPTQPVAALECSTLPDSICDSASKTGKLEDSSIWLLLIFALNIMTAGVGIVSVGAIAYAGFLYATAQGSSEQTKKALDMIRNTAIGLLLFAVMFALVNFLVPGGAFKGGALPEAPSSSEIAPAPDCPPGSARCAE